MSTFSHLSVGGEANMVDVSDKAVTVREATAQGYLYVDSAVIVQISEEKIAKGDVFAVARIAGIMAAKKTADLIPLCHPLPLSKVAVAITPDHDLPGFQVEAEARTSGQTGIEMEALTAVSTAALTVYDMLKAAEKGMEIKDICLLRKEGGKSGVYER